MAQQAFAEEGETKVGDQARATEKRVNLTEACMSSIRQQFAEQFNEASASASTPSDERIDASIVGVTGSGAVESSTGSSLRISVDVLLSKAPARLYKVIVGSDNECTVSEAKLFAFVTPQTEK